MSTILNRDVAYFVRCNTTANVFQCIQAADAEVLFGAINEVATQTLLPQSVWP
jgi:hypothetical protein